MRVNMGNSKKVSMENHILLTNLFLKESTVSFVKPEEAAKGGGLTISISAENILKEGEALSLDFIFKIKAEKDEEILFEIYCKFSSSFLIENSSAELSSDDEGKLATICFSQAYQGIRGYIADTLRRMNLLVPISALPFAIDFENQNITINSEQSLS